MKSYAYTHTSRMTPHGYSMHTVNLWRVKRNKLVFIDKITRSFMSEGQLIMAIMAKHKELPAKHLNKASTWNLKEDGVADIQRI